jgi:RNA polymerase sigma-70 factor (ECF subfamily)
VRHREVTELKDRLKSMATATGQALGWLDAQGIDLSPQDAPRTDISAASALDTEIATLVTAHSGVLYRICFSVLRDAGDTEDAVQETFLRVMRHRDKLVDIRNVRTWLVRIAFNLSLDIKRRRKHISLTDDAAELAAALPSRDLPRDVSLISLQRHAAILRIMDGLPRKERVVLLLSALDEMEIPEIAEVLEVTESTIRSRLFRARQMMRQRLQKAAK